MNLSPIPLPALSDDDAAPVRELLHGGAAAAGVKPPGGV